MEENKELDDFIRKAVKEVDLERPSVDFTKSVLSQIEIVTQKDSVLVAKPLFSKTIWFFLSVVVVGIFVYVIFNDSSTESTWLAAIKLNQLTSFNLSLYMPKFSTTTAFSYGSVGIAFFVWIQVFLLKRKWNKRYLIG